MTEMESIQFLNKKSVSESESSPIYGGNFPRRFVCSSLARGSQWGGGIYGPPRPPAALTSRTVLATKKILFI